VSSSNGATQIIAHRGGATGSIENSLEAFEYAITLGVEKIEFDVRRTGDGELIIFHDAHVTGLPIGSLTRAEIARRAGHLPARLVEVLDLARGRIGLDVELKESGHLDEVLGALDADLGAETTVVTSFMDEVIAELKRLRPDARAGLLVGMGRPLPHLHSRLTELAPIPRARACHADFIAPHIALARLGMLQRASDAGLPVYVWTVNDDHILRRLFADDRVSAVITDVPARALQLRAELAQEPDADVRA
jgi:glycerophosphoryl diester phosphodiesterase